MDYVCLWETLFPIEGLTKAVPNHFSGGVMLNALGRL
jgi:hypothetical protein